ncbi:MAG: T9SS type A sorting domain-containing protein, partial [Bacteroidota bacterium]
NEVLMFTQLNGAGQVLSEDTLRLLDDPLGTEAMFPRGLVAGTQGEFFIYSNEWLWRVSASGQLLAEHNVPHLGPIIELAVLDSHRLLVVSEQAITLTNDTGLALQSRAVPAAHTAVHYGNGNLWTARQGLVVQYDTLTPVDSADLSFWFSDIDQLNSEGGDLWVKGTDAQSANGVRVSTYGASFLLRQHFQVPADRMALNARLGLLPQRFLLSYAWFDQGAIALYDTANFALATSEWGITPSNITVDVNGWSPFFNGAGLVGFDAEITVLNNGQEPIDYFYLHATPVGVNCGGVLKYDRHDMAIPLLPGDSVTVPMTELWTSAAINGILEFCVTAVAPNGALETGLTDNDWCQSFAGVLSADVEAPGIVRWKLYPNPARDQVTFSLPADVLPSEGDQVQLLDLQGRVLARFPLEGHTGTLSLTDLAAGMYVVAITVNGQAFRKKLWRE